MKDRSLESILLELSPGTRAHMFEWVGGGGWSWVASPYERMQIWRLEGGTKGLAAESLKVFGTGMVLEPKR